MLVTSLEILKENNAFRFVATGINPFVGIIRCLRKKNHFRINCFHWVEVDQLSYTSDRTEINEF